MIKKHSNTVSFSSLSVDINTYAGLDEAGRGPLAGSVVAAAVVSGDSREWHDIHDSKAISASKREMLFDIIMTNALACAIGKCDDARKLKF